MPRPTPTVLLMALLLPLSPARAETTETCVPIERVERRAPVYVLIYGYRHATDQPLPALDMVAHDVRHMDRFYAALGPARTWVHAEREPQLVIPFGESLRPPTWQSLSTSVAEMISALDAYHGDARPQVYLYFVGHGDQPGGGVMDRGELYARPDPERSGPGHDGIIDARLLSDSVLRPLADRADVHFIADACRSFYLLSTRGGERIDRRTKQTVSADELIAPFARRLPSVGALLSTDGSSEVTYEDSRYGGLFSHAIRSAAIGPADTDRDGIVTYGEMHQVVGWILAGTGAGLRVATVPPGMDRDAPFIDWRSAPAAQICITPTMKGRQLIGTAAGNFASLNPPPGPHRIYLTAGQPYRFERAQGPFEFVAANGTLDVSGRTQPGVVGESYIEPFNQPLTPELLGDTPLAPAFVPGWYYGFGVVGHFGAMVLALPDAEVGLDLRNRLGRGLHRLLLDLGISRRDHAYRIAGDDTALEPIFGVIGSRLGYAYLLYHDAWEIDAGLIGGLDWTLSRRWDTGRLLDAALHVSAVRPFDGADAWSMRVDLRAGALMLARDVIEPFVQLGFGVDFETFVGW